MELDAETEKLIAEYAGKTCDGCEVYFQEISDALRDMYRRGYNAGATDGTGIKFG